MVAAPAITPAPNLALANAQGLMPRATTDFSLGFDCIDYNKVLGCDNGIVNCITSVAYQSNYLDGYTSCYCNYGWDYLTCFYSAIPATCAAQIGLGADFANYQISYFQSACGSVPASIMAQITPPSIVSLSLTTVRSTRLSTRSTPPPRTGTPLFTGTGKLISGRCSSTSFTLVDAGSTVYWAGFVGCINDRPECCPWSAARNTAAEGGTQTENRMGAAYPSPADGGLLTLAKCADDYYSISGSCCPNGYFPFTSQVGGQTPCYSSMNRMTTAPTLTANVLGEPTDTSKPTSAVVNLVWAVQYPVTSSGGGSSAGLSTGAIAGIAVGGLGAVALVVAAVVMLFRYRRKPNAPAPAPGAPAAAMAGGAPAGSEKIVVANTLPVEAQPNMPPQFGSPPPPQMQVQGNGFPPPVMAGQGMMTPPPGVQFVPQQPVQVGMVPYGAPGQVPHWGSSPPPPSSIGGPPSHFTNTPPPVGTWPSPPPPSLAADPNAAAAIARYSNQSSSVVGGSEISSLSGQAPLVPQVPQQPGGSPGAAAVLVPHYSGGGAGSPPPLGPGYAQPAYGQPHPGVIAEADEGRFGYAAPQNRTGTPAGGYMGEEMPAQTPAPGFGQQYQVPPGGPGQVYQVP